MDLSINGYVSKQSFQAVRVPLKEHEQNNIEEAQKAVEDVMYSDPTSEFINTNDYCAMFFNRGEKEKDYIDDLRKRGIDFQYSKIAETSDEHVKNTWIRTGRIPEEPCDFSDAIEKCTGCKLSSIV